MFIFSKTPRLAPAFLLLGIIAVAIFFRFWQLNEIPPSLWPDEAVNARQAWEALETKNFELFYPDNHGREGLFMNLIAIVFGIFGISMWSFKFLGAASGVLTVLGVYLLAKEIFINSKFKEYARWIALLSSFFVAASFWAVLFNRIAFRANLTPLVTVFSVYFLARGLRNKKLSDFAAAGLIFGIGLHTYIGFRVAIGAVALMLVCWLVIAAYQGWFKKYLLAAAIFILGFFITAGPMIWYFSENPEDFIGRASGVSITNQPEPLVALSKSFAAHLGMFNIYGDPNSRHNIPGAPMLAYPVGFLFLIGWWYALSKVFVSLWRIVSNRTKASIKEHGFPLVFYGMFFVWFFAFLAPGFLTYEGIPHALRVLGIIPVVYLLAGLGGYLFFAWLRQFFAKWPVMTALLKIGSVGLLLILVATTWYQYFYKWGANPEMHNAFTTRFADVGKTLNSFPEKTPKYVIMSEGDLPVESTRFVQKTAGRQEAIYITREEARTRSFSSGDLIFTMNKEYEDVSALVQKYPQGETVEFERFWMFKVR